MPLLKPQHDRLINLNAITVALVEHNSTQKLTQLKSKSANIIYDNRYLRSKSPYSVRIQENTDQKNSVFRQFLRGDNNNLSTFAELL